VIGRAHHVAYDCRDPQALAAFCSALLGLPVTYTSPDWVVVAEGRLAGGDDVYVDPAGHPFCLVPRPSWAPPVDGRLPAGPDDPVPGGPARS
jgi:catechol 2,3-dioxygenase-like lactoylglutathione lyase family enzyme